MNRGGGGGGGNCHTELKTNIISAWFCSTWRHISSFFDFIWRILGLNARQFDIEIFYIILINIVNIKIVFPQAIHQNTIWQRYWFDLFSSGMRKLYISYLYLRNFWSIIHLMRKTVLYLQSQTKIQALITDQYLESMSQYNTAIWYECIDFPSTSVHTFSIHMQSWRQLCDIETHSRYGFSHYLA